MFFPMGKNHENSEERRDPGLNRRTELGEPGVAGHSKASIFRGISPSKNEKKHDTHTHGDE